MPKTIPDCIAIANAIASNVSHSASAHNATYDRMCQGYPLPHKSLIFNAIFLCLHLIFPLRQDDKCDPPKSHTTFIAGGGRCRRTGSPSLTHETSCSMRGKGRNRNNFRQDIFIRSLYALLGSLFRSYRTEFLYF